MKHDADIREFELDEQTTAWVMTCRRCHRKARPVYRKDDAQECLEEDTCSGEKPESDYNAEGYTAALRRAFVERMESTTGFDISSGQFLRNVTDFGLEQGWLVLKEYRGTSYHYELTTEGAAHFGLVKTMSGDARRCSK